MYCIRVQEGRERIQVRYYQNGFLPCYRPVSPSGRAEGKRLVIPGYIFMLKPAPRAEKVPDTEWKVIEAVSDPRVSVMDFEAGVITEGPLKAVGEYIAAASPKRVKVSAQLFGEKREFWLAIRDEKEVQAEREAESAEQNGMNGGEEDPEIRTGKKEEKAVAAAKKTEYTEEQKAKMLARAEEVGVHAAAAEFSIPWQTLAQIRRKAGKAEKPVRDPGAAAPEDPEALRKENAALRKRVAELEKKINALRNAFRDLMET